MKRLAVLVSGRGSNLQSIIDAIDGGRLDASIVVVISNRRRTRPGCSARATPGSRRCLGAARLSDRDCYDRAIVDALRARGVDLVCLAGFMRLVGSPLLDAFPQRMLNIHPSLLPSFPGLDAQRQAIDHGVQFSGATVHFVTPELDGGPIVLQAVRAGPADDDTADTLSERILVEEHRMYPEAIRLVLAGGWTIEGRRFMTAWTKPAAYPGRSQKFPKRSRR